MTLRRSSVTLTVMERWRHAQGFGAAECSVGNPHTAFGPLRRIVTAQYAIVPCLLILHCDSRRPRWARHHPQVSRHTIPARRNPSICAFPRSMPCRVDYHYFSAACGVVYGGGAYQLLCSGHGGNAERCTASQSSGGKRSGVAMKLPSRGPGRAVRAPAEIGGPALVRAPHDAVAERREHRPVAQGDADMPVRVGALVEEDQAARRCATAIEWGADGIDDGRLETRLRDTRLAQYIVDEHLAPSRPRHAVRPDLLAIVAYGGAGNGGVAARTGIIEDHDIQDVGCGRRLRPVGARSVCPSVCRLAGSLAWRRSSGSVRWRGARSSRSATSAWTKGAPASRGRGRAGRRACPGEQRGGDGRNRRCCGRVRCGCRLRGGGGRARCAAPDVRRPFVPDGGAVVGGDGRFCRHRCGRRGARAACRDRRRGAHHADQQEATHAHAGDQSSHPPGHDGIARVALPGARRNEAHAFPLTHMPHSRPDQLPLMPVASAFIRTMRRANVYVRLRDHCNITK